MEKHQSTTSSRRWNGGGGSSKTKTPPAAASNKQAAAILSPFNPLTPGGTIYLAFVFLIPLTVGKLFVNGRRGAGAGADRATVDAGQFLSPSDGGGDDNNDGPLQRIMSSVRSEQETLYKEMNLVDGNLMVRTALKSMRNNMAEKWWNLWSRRRIERLLTIKQKKKKKKLGLL